MTTPAQQVAAALAATPPGQCPPLPPFLIVTKADMEQRRLNWERNPPKPMPKFADNRGPVVDPAQMARMAEANATEKKKAAETARLNALHTTKAQSWVDALPEGERHWDTRLGRWVPNNLDVSKLGAIAAIKAIEAAARHAHAPQENASRRAATRIKHAAATGKRIPQPVKRMVLTTAPASDNAKKIAAHHKAELVEVAMPGDPVKGTQADDITATMLKRPEGTTQEELAKALGSTGDAARGRISKVCRARKLNVTRTKESRGGVYRVA